MSEDLIRRSDAIKALDANFTIKGKENMQTVLNYLELVRTRIEGAPTIDIVRCKECMHWDRAIDESGIERFNFSKCVKGHCGNGFDFYCAYGEREGE